jgi:glyoxylase-like metal-dependent hydrolase (beta-lactamase superfamily II)
MFQHIKEIIHQGDESGNNMTVKFRLPSGLEIIGLPTKNFYGEDWDLGPTWNYAVLADEPFLVDTGRYGQGRNLVGMMDSAGIKPEDLGFVLISHSHEDHDGGLGELVNLTQLKVKAHAIYDLIIRKYPKNAPPGYKEDFPAKCWRCMMPEEYFTKNCLAYHKILQGLTVDKIPDGVQELSTNIQTYHLPGHSPDCLAVRIGDEAILVGDIILPEITSIPTCESSYYEVSEIIKHAYSKPEEIFGLLRYIRSLKKLGEIAERTPNILVLSAHRLYYKNQWNGMKLAGRVDELLKHHIDRCAAILEILEPGPKTAEEIAREHFEERLLKGQGKLMAENEVISHCELLIKSKDVVTSDSDKYAATGSTNFEEDIETL